MIEIKNQQLNEINLQIIQKKKIQIQKLICLRIKKYCWKQK